MTKVFLTGGSSGIGLECKNLLTLNNYDVTAPSSLEFNLLDHTAIDNVDLSIYDVVINSAGINTGTYLGFTHNSPINQTNQVLVNMVGPVLLLKQYMKTRDHGHFVFISSMSIENPHTYNIFNAASKAGLRFAMDTIRREATNFVISEICPGKTKTNMLRNNYNGSKSESEIDLEYEENPYLEPEDVAKLVLQTVIHKHTFSSIDVSKSIVTH